MYGLFVKNFTSFYSVTFIFSYGISSASISSYPKVGFLFEVLLTNVNNVVLRVTFAHVVLQGLNNFLFQKPNLVPSCPPVGT